MKLFKRIMIIFLVIVCFAIIFDGIRLSQMGKTVDCLGVVDSIDVNKKTIKIIDSNRVEYLLNVRFYTSVKDMNDTKIDIDKIKVGDTISANYRGEWKKANIALDATYIRVVGK